MLFLHALPTWTLQVPFCEVLEGYNRDKKYTFKEKFTHAEAHYRGSMSSGGMHSSGPVPCSSLEVGGHNGCKKNMTKAGHV